MHVGGTFADGFLSLGPFLPALPLARVHRCYRGRTTFMAKDMRSDAGGR